MQVIITTAPPSGALGLRPLSHRYRPLSLLQLTKNFKFQLQFISSFQDRQMEKAQRYIKYKGQCVNFTLPPV